MMLWRGEDKTSEQLWPWEATLCWRLRFPPPPPLPPNQRQGAFQHVCLLTTKFFTLCVSSGSS